MDLEDQRRIQKCLPEVKAAIAEDLDTLVNSLIQQEVFELSAFNDILHAARKEDMFIKQLVHSGRRSFKIFLTLLKELGHVELVTKIEQAGTAQLGPVRGNNFFSNKRRTPEAAGASNGEANQNHRLDVDAHIDQMLSLILRKVSKLEPKVASLERGQEQIQAQIGEVKQGVAGPKYEDKTSIQPQKPGDNYQRTPIVFTCVLPKVKPMPSTGMPFRRERTVGTDTFKEFENENGSRTPKPITTDYDKLLQENKRLYITQAGLKVKVNDMKEQMSKLRNEIVLMKSREQNLEFVNQMLSKENDKLKTENKDFEEKFKEVELEKRKKEEDFTSLMFQMQLTMEQLDKMNLQDKDKFVWKRSIAKLDAAFQRSMDGKQIEQETKHLDKTLAVGCKPLTQRFVSQNIKTTTKLPQRWMKQK